MLLNADTTKRLGILCFFDEFGIVDQYVTYLLADLTKNFSDTLIVVNGKLEPKERQKLEFFGTVIERENQGFDVWAYKHALSHIGWNKLNDYDEVILFNNTMMGPVYPFSESFEKMDTQDLDFWGITSYFKQDSDPFGTIKYGHIPDHIQSYFIAVRKSLFSAKAFHQYWDEMKEVNSYAEAIGFHETIFTKHFSDLGYQWSTSVEMQELRDFNNNPLLICPKKLVADYRCPVFKRNSFSHEINDTLHSTSGEQLTALYHYLQNHADYDVDLIWNPILRTSHQYDLAKNMNLLYNLSTQHCDAEKIKTLYKNKKIALIFHIYFEDLIQESLNWTKAMPEFSHLYITTDSEKKKAKIHEILTAIGTHQFEIHLVENRGRDVAALLVGLKDIILDYDLVCFAHDKKTTHLKPSSVGASFSYKCFENTLSNQTLVYNVLETFEKNPRLGILSPPGPNHANFFPILGFEWTTNFTLTSAIYRKLGLTVPINEFKPPLAPFGSVFWFRPKALKRLFEENWQYKDFPIEPVNSDGTLLHAIERVYPYVAQEAGYYPAILMSDKFSAIEFMNLYHYVRSFNLAIQSDSHYFDDRIAETARQFYINHGIKNQAKILFKLITNRILNRGRHKRVKRLKELIR
ncbi:Rhamnan synthesis protein F [Legionella massiliensis]|uniref:Rhamnan synthesis protein F n=1 Tax=Legionella massiliensis TaxID=1034943 RepID=A0A078KWU3_9GAMM|nr:rhamnan synthesis F family protein [Legionella massiliensis]CDZ76239.1 Rhamnan synthesis protein F [Legionella massiliensis]CEE11977.1 Rhamnan synthesis protein F [Legionella massiliensis]